LRLGQSTVRAIEPGNADREVDMSRVGVYEGGTIRRENGALFLSCSQCLGGTFTLLSEQGLTASTESDVEDLLKGKRGRKASRIKMHYLYDVTETRSLNPVLEFPRSNVKYFEETLEPSRTWGWVGLGSGLLLTGVGVFMLAEGSVGGGVGLLIPGLGLGGFGVYQLLKSPSIRRYDSEGNRMQAPLPRPEPSEPDEDEEKDEWKPATEEKEEDKSFFDGEREKESQPAEEPEPEPEPEAKPEPEPEPEPEAEPEPEPEPEPKKKPRRKPKKPKGGEKFDDFLL